MKDDGMVVSFGVGVFVGALFLGLLMWLMSGIGQKPEPGATCKAEWRTPSTEWIELRSKPYVDPNYPLHLCAKQRRDNKTICVPVMQVVIRECNKKGD